MPGVGIRWDADPIDPKGESNMQLGTRMNMGQMSDRWQLVRNAKRVDRLDEENGRLRTELRMTRSELEREREREQSLLDALNRASERKTKVTANPRGGLLRLIVVVGAAYIFGTKAGRERYDQISAWAVSTKRRLTARSQGLVDLSDAGTIPQRDPLTKSDVRSAVSKS
jgi:hypothetical protein